MRFLVLGAGKMGYAAIYDLCKFGGADAQIMVVDSHSAPLDNISARFNDSRVSVIKADVGNTEELAYLMSGADVVISCVTYKFNYDLSKAAIEAGASFVDLGGNEDIVRRQFLLDEMARQKNVSVIPDCGLAPGIVSLLAAAAYEELDDVTEIKLRVGGLPIEPKMPLDYALFFSTEGLINEYVEDATIIRDGKLLRVPSLVDLEELEFPAPFGMMEAFNTSGGVSTLPATLGAKVSNLDYKTIRYPGHCAKIKLLKDLGLMDSNPIVVNQEKVAPRAVLAALFDQKLPREEPDVVLVRVEVTGRKEGEQVTVQWECVDYMDETTGLSAMMRMTAFPVSIIAQMIARGDIMDKGSLYQELSVPRHMFLEEMKRRGVSLVRTEKKRAVKV
ncbi:MAG: saccharopine dehydrogenase NADP-binding domain-containing protein [Candidatus Obscuribacterales bacterium]|nr:saccharopine dehydrogenase NADP-binding domain-containing protein [Candidatus Obscuribacterales bacterium]